MLEYMSWACRCGDRDTDGPAGAIIPIYFTPNSSFIQRDMENGAAAEHAPSGGIRTPDGLAGAQIQTVTPTPPPVTTALSTVSWSQQCTQDCTLTFLAAASA